LKIESIQPFGERFPSSLVLTNKNLARRGFHLRLRASLVCDI
jgi:hypothetical protein